MKKKKGDQTVVGKEPHARLDKVRRGMKDGGHFIQKAIKHPGALRAAAHKAGESTHQFAEKHKHDSGKTGNRARLALTLSKLRPHK